jgi:Response regulators consisting of a CheY-like receiver domain and a winged-helix DNA-binding domain
MQKPQIVLVEDTLELASLISAELRAASFEVQHCEQGEVALQLLKSQPCDLLILDWMLPDIAGIEVLRQLRSFSGLPVLMLTARDTELDRVLGLELGADDYLTKPFSMRELVARVRALLRRRSLIEQTLQADQSRNQGLIELGELQIDPQAHQATLAGQVIDLSRSEFSLLYLLASNPGRVFSRAYLLDTLWNEQYVSGDRSVDNAVLRLRRKIEPFGEQLETVWGVGYRWRR